MWRRWRRRSSWWWERFKGCSGGSPTFPIRKNGSRPARALRTEQDREHQLADRLRDLKVQCAAADERLATMQKRVAEMRELERAIQQRSWTRCKRMCRRVRLLPKSSFPRYAGV
ncbi:hypothetical protein BCR44DRAFT_1084853 [Catenaria anguillulae PL171]|uniref:Uncharacterized protein n=1 Tax=Catenaria anguillulae PL171 TaxID=765915 RepID=A0A1Y2HNP8_9FUNG|nr:hypothetical protein BCR44DRAFT_1084853 [Catenaria anguillulae PL171]